MRKALFYFLIAPILCASLAACGDSGHRTTNPHAVPIVLTMQDQPPAGLTIESFVVQVTGVSMTGTAGQANVSLLPSPVTVNLSNLATSNTLLAKTSAPAGTYSGITITFASPQLTVLNNSGTTFTDGTNSCPSSNTTTSPCTLTPALSPMSATLTSSPFPLSLVSGTPIHPSERFGRAHRTREGS